MKRMVKRIGALAFGAMILASSSMVVSAAERSYTYNYDYWGDVQDSPDAYEVVTVLTAKDLGLDKNLLNPSGLTVNGDEVFLCDTGNNRILQLKRTGDASFELVRTIDSIKGNVEVKTLSGPTDIVVSEAGNYFIADKGNARILKVDADLNYIMEFNKPDDSTLDPELVFQPSKLAVDTAERVYCTATAINKGLVKYENDGVFSGFVGAPKATFNFIDYLWKKFATQAQRAQMVNFVPTEYDNLYMDYEGFIYVCAGGLDEEKLDNGEADAVRKLNLLGSDILVRNGEYYVLGDLYWGEGGGHKGPSYFSDVTCFDNDIYVCLDRNRGRLFGYDDQGKLVYAFGSNGSIDGYFRQPVALDHMGYDLLVLDSMDNTITVFTPTDFGKLVYQAMDQFDAGDYEASTASWQEIMNINGNYDLAYIGIGRSLLRQEKYHEAMEYFELKYDDENYSKAFKQYRKEWVEDNIVIIVIVILALFLIPMIIGKVKSIKREIDIADIFRT